MIPSFTEKTNRVIEELKYLGIKNESKKRIAFATLNEFVKQNGLNVSIEEIDKAIEKAVREVV